MASQLPYRTFRPILAQNPTVTYADFGPAGWIDQGVTFDVRLLTQNRSAVPDRLLGTSAQAADLARYVHHQTRDRFDVLRSKPIASHPRPCVRLNGGGCSRIGLRGVAPL